MGKLAAVPSHKNTSRHRIADSIILSLEEMPIENSLSTSELNLDDKSRSNPLPWRGQFSPELVESLLIKYCPPNGRIVDPFAGSGTVLLEATRLSLAADGIEINPAAYHLAKIYEAANYPIEERKAIMRQIEKHLVDRYSFGLDGNHTNEMSHAWDGVIGVLRTGAPNSLRTLIVETLVILMDLWKGIPNANAVFSTWKRLSGLLLSLDYRKKPVRMHLADARNIPIDNQSADFIVTSPPYINVFNYHQQYRRSAEYLGYSLLEAAKSEIGSNRKNRSNRYLTVTQYIIDMYDVFLELGRICKYGSTALFVVGRESNVRKTRFFNSEILASVAVLSGARIKARQERVFTNRYGQAIYEDVLHFEIDSRRKSASQETVRTLATQVLTNAIDRAPQESLQDLISAINEVDEIQASPILQRVEK